MNNSLHLTQAQDLQILQGFPDSPGNQRQGPCGLWTGLAWVARGFKNAFFPPYISIAQNQIFITFAWQNLRLETQNTIHNLLNTFYLITDEDIFNRTD